MTTAAAIDRVVHHSVTLEMAGASVRADAAERAKKERATSTTNTTTASTGPDTERLTDGEVQLSLMGTCS